MATSAIIPAGRGWANTEAYLKRYAQLNHHFPVTYLIGNRKVVV